MRDFFKGGMALWLSPIGGFVATMMVTYPANCPSPLGTCSVLTNICQPRVCHNVLGFDPWFSNAATSTGLAFVLAGACYGLAMLFGGGADSD